MLDKTNMEGIRFRMKVNYFREMKEHHMVIAAEEHLCPQYQMNMVGKNPIPGLLVPVVRLMNGEVLYDYSITGCQSLQTLTELAPISKKMLAALVLELNHVLEELERYLVDSDYLALRPEFIYVEMRRQEPVRVNYCFFPFQSQTAEEQMRELMKYVLNEVDYQDRAAVNLVYELFQQASQENFLIRQLSQVVEEANLCEASPETTLPCVEETYSLCADTNAIAGRVVRECGTSGAAGNDVYRVGKGYQEDDTKPRKRLFNSRINRRGREIVLSDILK